MTLRPFTLLLAAAGLAVLIAPMALEQAGAQSSRAGASWQIPPPLPKEPPPEPTQPPDQDQPPLTLPPQGAAQPSLGARWPAGCLFAEHASVSLDFRAESIDFCGVIDEDAVKAVSANLVPTVRRITIRSMGGELDAPLDLAEIIRTRGLGVRVEGPCLSACAAFVFVAARNRYVAPGSVLGLHNSSSSVVEIADRLRDRMTTPLDENSPLVRRATGERRLYDLMRVNTALLFEPQARIDTVCMVPTSPSPISREQRFNLVSRYDFWAPTAEQWRRFGVAFYGDVPGTAYEAEETVNRFTLGRGGARLKVAMDPSLIPPARQSFDHVAYGDDCPHVPAAAPGARRVDRDTRPDTAFPPQSEPPLRDPAMSDPAMRPNPVLPTQQSPAPWGPSR